MQERPIKTFIWFILGLHFRLLIIADMLQCHDYIILICSFLIGYLFISTFSSKASVVWKTVLYWDHGMSLTHGRYFVWHRFILLIAPWGCSHAALDTVYFLLTLLLYNYSIKLPSILMLEMGASVTSSVTCLKTGATQRQLFVLLVSKTTVEIDDQKHFPFSKVSI